MKIPQIKLIDFLIKEIGFVLENCKLIYKIDNKRIVIDVLKKNPEKIKNITNEEYLTVVNSYEYVLNKKLKKFFDKFKFSNNNNKEYLKIQLLFKILNNFGYYIDNNKSIPLYKLIKIF